MSLAIRTSVVAKDLHDDASSVVITTPACLMCSMGRATRYLVRGTRQTERVHETVQSNVHPRPRLRRRESGARLHDVIANQDERSDALEKASAIHDVHSARSRAKDRSRTLVN